MAYTVVKVGGGRPTNDRDQHASLHAMLEDSATFGKYGVISQKRRKIDIKSLWMTCRKSYTVY